MTVRWIEDEGPGTCVMRDYPGQKLVDFLGRAARAEQKPGMLGALSAAENLQAKFLLASWNSTDGNHCVLKYGSQAPDIDSNWGPRDDEALGCFSKWWNDAGKSPKLSFSSKGAFGEPPKSSADLTQAHLGVLKSWAASSPAFRFHAKSVLAMWNRAQNPPIFAGYPEPSDLTNLGWGWRDGKMLGNFVLWWNIAANPPLANWGQQSLPQPSFSTGIQQSALTEEHAAALNTWAQKTGAGLPSCIESCLIDTGGVTPLSATPPQIAECVGQCSGVAPTPQPQPPPCPAGFAWDGQKCVSLLPPGQPPTCPPGQLINAATGQCSVPPPSCAVGWTWDDVKKACVPPGAPVTPPPAPPTPAKAATKSNAGVVLAVLAGVGLLGLLVNAAIKVPAPPAMQLNPKRRRAKSTVENPHTRGCSVVTTLGDVNPIEYGGGYLFLCKPGNEYRVEYTHGTEQIEEASGMSEFDPAYSRLPLTVYRVDLPADVWAENTWVTPEEVAPTIGADPEELREAGSSSDPRERLYALESITSHWSWDELDHYPISMTVSELRKRWHRALRSK